MHAANRCSCCWLPAGLQEWLHEFAWTQASLPVQKARRNQQLQDVMAGGTTLEEQLLPSLLPGIVSLMEAAARLEKEPMFCMELALRLFYWTRLAKLYGVGRADVGLLCHGRRPALLAWSRECLGCSKHCSNIAGTCTMQLQLWADRKSVV